jgi:hypothetical protein
MPSGGVSYAIGIPGRPYVKIGKTTGPVSKRLAVHQCGQPEPLPLLATVQVDTDLTRIEKAIHTFLATEHRRGERFACDVDQAQLEALIVREARST